MFEERVIEEQQVEGERVWKQGQQQVQEWPGVTDQYYAGVNL